MKKMLLAVAIAAVATMSCSKNEAFDNTSTNNTIDLRAAVGKAVKATDVTTANLNEFGIMSILSNGEYLGTGGTVYYSDTYTKSTSVWTAGTTHYWPTATDTKLSFFGYYDGALSSVISTSGAYPAIVDYTVADAAADQKDLIVASAMNQTKPISDATPIDLTFKHALSKVNVSAKTEDATYFVKIKSVSFKNVFNKATFTYNAVVGTWVINEATTGAYNYFSGEAKINSTTATPIHIDETGKAMMFIPQTHNTQDIVVSYDVYVTAADGKTEVLIDSKSDVSTALSDLVMGKNYRYTLTIPKSGTEIKLNVDSVEEWGTEEEK